MRYAIVDNKKVKASTDIKNAICDCCKKPVKAFCGEINIPHFRHVSKIECDSWYEPMTEWHLNWQNKFKESFIEVVIDNNNFRHRADIKNSKGTVIEFQKSAISPAEIRAREHFYGKMVWVFSGIEFRKNVSLSFKWDTDFESESHNIKGYVWKWPKKHLFHCKMPVFIDFGTDYLYFINFSNKDMPKFFTRESDCHSTQNGSEWWESYVTEHFQPVKLIHKNDFINHYNV